MLFLQIISLQAQAVTYYVSLAGNDSNNGTTISTPFASVTKALTLMASGDKTYVRGGVYYLFAGISISKSGSLTDTCFLLAYPGERPVFDFSGVSSGTRGITLTGSYWKIKGFDIRKAGDNGMNINKGGNNVIEHCSFYDNQDSGLQIDGGAFDNKIINCDSYFNADPPDYGDADGFACKMAVGSGNYFYGCRSWLNVDDGWDGYLRGTDNVTNAIENCWTWRNGFFKDGTDGGANANGNGFKMGGSDNKLLQHNFTLKNCIAFDNKSKGFDQNNNKGTMILYNCTGYRNGGNNFSISQALAAGKILEVKNCVAVDKKVSLGSFAIQVTNSWMSQFTVTNDDFASLDTTGISGPRKADGSLPDVSFLHLKNGSDLINGGTNVGIPYSGSAPDLGAFETSLTTGLQPLPSPGGDQFQFMIYPVPFHDQLTVQSEIPVPEKVYYSIYNLSGKKIRSSEPITLSRDPVKINSECLPAGIYVFEIHSGDLVQQTKIVKN